MDRIRVQIQDRDSQVLITDARMKAVPRVDEDIEIDSVGYTVYSVVWQVENDTHHDVTLVVC